MVNLAIIYRSEEGSRPIIVAEIESRGVLLGASLAALVEASRYGDEEETRQALKEAGALPLQLAQASADRT